LVSSFYTQAHSTNHDASHFAIFFNSRLFTFT
jgi:hypothetical protein